MDRNLEQHFLVVQDMQDDRAAWPAADCRLPSCNLSQAAATAASLRPRFILLDVLSSTSAVLGELRRINSAALLIAVGDWESESSVEEFDGYLVPPIDRTVLECLSACEDPA